MASSSAAYATSEGSDGAGAASELGTFKFPAFNPDALPPFEEEEHPFGASRSSTPVAPTSNRPLRSNTATNTGGSSGRWLPKRENARWTNVATSQQQHSSHGGGRHGRQKSLSEALRTIRTRRASVSQNAHEIADALKAPVSPTLVLLCIVWYATSISSNTSSKAILTALPKPVTLTLVQFAFVSSFCVILSRAARVYPFLKTWIPALKHEIRPPSRDIIITTLPLTVFQIGGHILTSDAMSRIPVSLVHTIKGLSPLFTVLAYRLVYHIHYRPATYLSLIPLTLGVVMACSADLSGSWWGIVCAFASTILFVTQNIVSKKLFNEAAQAEADGAPAAVRARKPDKLNLLCYSTGLAFLLTCPIWLWSEGFGLLADVLTDAAVELTEKPGSLDHGRLALEFVFNGTFHFGQNLVAFALLGMVSPVTYSVASLIKRVAVILFALVWFGNPVSAVQAAGIALTFVGLYLYDRTSDAARADRRARLQQLREQNQDHLLPLSAKADVALPTVATQPPPHQHQPPPPQYMQSPVAMDAAGAGGTPPPLMNGYVDTKKSDDAVPSGGAGGNGAPSKQPSMRVRAGSNAAWLPPGTRQEDTWRAGDRVRVS